MMMSEKNESIKEEPILSITIKRIDWVFLYLLLIFILEILKNHEITTCLCLVHLRFIINTKHLF